VAADDAFRDQLKALGEFINAQRNAAQMSLRDLSKLTQVSNPYLSQIEHGKHEPSLRVLRSIATALNVSFETLLLRAGLLEPEDENGDPRVPDVETAIHNDPKLTDEQRASLLAVYKSYLH
jgi:transcriptional regulator with XRE-family HTH domain